MLKLDNRYKILKNNLIYIQPSEKCESAQESHFLIHLSLTKTPVNVVIFFKTFQQLTSQGNKRDPVYTVDYQHTKGDNHWQNGWQKYYGTYYFGII